MTFDAIGIDYSRHRKADPRIAAFIHRALGHSATVLNVGAGTGSYEPTDRDVVAVEPSSVMIAQRSRGSASVVQASAEALPFPDRSFDAAMALLTIHHWRDWWRGLEEMRRVAARIVLLTWDPSHDGFWLTRDYFPELLEMDRNSFPPIESIRSVLEGGEIQTVPVPADCTDGFLASYWCRPEAYLDADRRRAISSFRRIRDVSSPLGRLARDLEAGEWHRRNDHLLTRKFLDAGYRLFVR